MLEISTLAAKPFRCPICGPSILVRISADATGVRCLRCGASAITLSLVRVLSAARPEFAKQKVYELSARGPLFNFLRGHVADLRYSEYFDEVDPGTMRNGVVCQDVQRLTFADGSFDLCTSTEVMEHVGDDRLAFAEIHRVLRPGGAFIFTVPLSERPTVERARPKDGEIEHLLPAAYHTDRIRGPQGVLVFRDYGPDIIERLQFCGFVRASIDRRCARTFLGYGAPVIVAQRD